MKGNVKSIVLRAGVGLAFMFAAGAAYAGPGCCGSKQDTTVKKVAVKSSDGLKAQEVCPIMGGKINKEVFVDVAGYRFYACCPSCLPKIKADPEAALKILKEKGQKPELLADAKACGKSCDKKCDSAKSCDKKCDSAKSCKGDSKSKCASSCSKGDAKNKSCSKSCDSDCKKDAKSAAKCCSGDKKADAKCCGSKDKVAAKACSSKGSCSGKDAKAKSCSSSKSSAKSSCTSKSCKGSDACKGSEKVAVCDKCGALAGEKDCCKGTGTKCDKCGLVKRSADCCKVSKPAEPVKS